MDRNEKVSDLLLDAVKYWLLILLWNSIGANLGVVHIGRLKEFT